MKKEENRKTKKKETGTWAVTRVSHVTRLPQQTVGVFAFSVKI
jgi:hypothetical protein